MDSNYPTTFLKSILAGIVVAISSTLYLIVENHTVGAFLFSLGLLCIYTLDFYLFIGKAGYLLIHRRLDKLVIVWFGNLLGTMGTAFLLSQTRLTVTTPMIEAVTNLSTTKISDTPVSLFILGIFCGLVIFIAAECYQRTRGTANSVGGYLTVVVCVMLFILCGFEQSIADMFYFSLAGAWSMDAVFALIIISLGNALGALLIPLVALLMESED